MFGRDHQGNDDRLAGRDLDGQRHGGRRRQIAPLLAAEPFDIWNGTANHCQRSASKIKCGLVEVHHPAGIVEDRNRQHRSGKHRAVYRRLRLSGEVDAVRLFVDPYRYPDCCDRHSNGRKRCGESGQLPPRRPFAALANTSAP
jgi:hypothetical protein